MIAGCGYLSNKNNAVVCGAGCVSFKLTRKYINNRKLLESKSCTIFGCTSIILVTAGKLIINDSKDLKVQKFDNIRLCSSRM